MGAHLVSNVGGELCMSWPLLHPIIASRTDASEGHNQESSPSPQKRKYVEGEGAGDTGMFQLGGIEAGGCEDLWVEGA